jgi:2-polyprenyl-6-methoxyphenol hydroxylase-like FAD-dependent oxidoreductase
MPQPCTVLIAGAGPVGLALALALTRAGIAVRIVDKAAQRSTTSKAIGLQYRVSEILAILGVAERFLVVGGSPTVVNLYVGRRKLAALRFIAPPRLSGRGAFQPRAIMIAQSETERLLGEALAEAGIQIEWNAEFVAFSQGNNGVSAQLRRPNGDEQAEVAWLVGCDGAHSAVRKQAGLCFAGKSYPLAFFMADVQVDWAPDHGENHVWFHPDGIFAALPFPSPRQWRLFVEVTHRPDIGTLTADIIKTLMVERTGAAEAHLGEPTWLSEFRISRRMVDRMRSGRVLVAGNAAHVHSPMGGQGIATGIQDAVNLAWKLSRVIRGAPDGLLDSYGAERLPEIRAVLEETDRNAQIFLAPNVALRLLRDVLVLPLMRSSMVQRGMFNRLSQIHVSYRGSSLAVHDDRDAWWRPTRLKAGDRAPDLSFQDPAGKSRITLFQCLKSLRPVALIAFEPRRDANLLSRLCRALAALDIEAYVVLRAGERAQLGVRCLVDHHDELGQLYRMRPDCLCLIRPDGHIGLFQRPIRLHRLRAYLACVSAPEALARAWSEHRL